MFDRGYDNAWWWIKQDIIHWWLTILHKNCPDCGQANTTDPNSKHSYHCIAGDGYTCLGCFSCQCGRSDCPSPCKC